jgi:hypothetical protein
MGPLAPCAPAWIAIDSGLQAWGLEIPLGSVSACWWSWLDVGERCEDVTYLYIARYVSANLPQWPKLHLYTAAVVSIQTTIRRNQRRV